MAATPRRIILIFLLFTATTAVACSRDVRTISHANWNPAAAAAYLDRRAEWWTEWPGAARDGDTFCISCHTTLPYALARPTLDQLLSQGAAGAVENRLLDDIVKRVRLWSQLQPYYDDEGSGSGKSVQSWGTEAVLNALILGSRDARRGRGLSDDSRRAFDILWKIQQTHGDDMGSWPWLNFNLSPWEATDSRYYGAALAALATGTAPADYRSEPGVASHVRLLRDFLLSRYFKQSLSNRLVVLWASTKWTDLLDADHRQSLVVEVLREQLADGGWSEASLARSWRSSTFHSYVRSWIRSDKTLIETKSDGYATGLVVFVLLTSGTPLDNVQVERGLSWLVENQNKTEGLWPASSLNKRRDPTSDSARFMSDAATAFATLALTEAGRR
jgi:squalene-hopene/tetraprenyl-beta-curcumene cyclase